MMLFGRGFPDISSSFTVDDVCKVGGGNYSVVIRGHVRGKTVAAKQNFNHGESGSVTCWAEMEILDHLRRRNGNNFWGPRNHRHIIVVLGFAKSPSRTRLGLNADPYLIMEYHPHGSLKSYLESSVLIDDSVRANGQCSSAAWLQHPVISNADSAILKHNVSNAISGNPLGDPNNPSEIRQYVPLPEPEAPEKNNVTVPQLTQWAYEIASALKFLSINKVAHNDLALRNVLLSSNNEAILSDFGVAKMLNGNGVYQLSAKEARDMPFRSFPPEYFQNRRVGRHTEVWAFGIFLWELFMLGRETPYENFDHKLIPSALRNGYRLSRPKYASKQMYQLMTDCWDEDPDARPTFETICRRLQDMMLLRTESEHHDRYETTGYSPNESLIMQCANAMSCLI